jgi:hypothetical protein
MACSGRGIFTLEEGYWSPLSNPAFLYECHDNVEACPGGDPYNQEAKCADGRDYNSLSCGDCKDGYRAKVEGGCEKCEDGESWPFFLAAIIGVAAVIAMYILVNQEDRAKTKASSLLISMSVGLIVTVFQQLKVFSLMPFFWPEPFKSFMKFSSIFGFDMEFVRVGCLYDAGPVGSFAMKLCNIAVLLFVLGVTHAVYAAGLAGPWKPSPPGCKENLHLLTNSYGALFFAFATAIASLTFTPFICNDHPNNEETTLESYPTVKCWESSDHAAMVVIGIFSIIILLVCVTACCVAIYRFSGSMRHGNTYFLKMYSFLFSRFRVGAQYWGIVCLLRGLAVALMPALPNVVSQCLLMLTLLLYSTSTMYLRPWRIMMSNLLDVFVCVGLICILSLAVFFCRPAKNGNSLHPLLHLDELRRFLLACRDSLRCRDTFQKDKGVSVFPLSS